MVIHITLCQRHRPGRPQHQLAGHRGNLVGPSDTPTQSHEEPLVMPRHLHCTNARA